MPGRDEQTLAEFEATIGVLAVIVLQVVLSLVSEERGWTLWSLPWWTWLTTIAPLAGLVAALVWHRRLRPEQLGKRRKIALTLLGLVGLANALTLVALIGSIASGQEHSGGQLLFKGAVVWLTNVIAFGLAFWELDRGGPVRRVRHESYPPWPDFQFPQMEDEKLTEPSWQPRLFDYVYIAFTNAFAFSPTDAMPLTRRAKMLMLLGSAVSAVTVLLVAARAVNIF